MNNENLQTFTPNFKLALPHGIAAGVSLPGKPIPIHPSILEILHPEEQAFALTLEGYRQMYWVGGRLALNLASRHLGIDPQPMLSLPTGQIAAPEGLAVSISHKRTLAVGMISYSNGGTLGVDIEDLYPPRPGIAHRVLTEEEYKAVQDLIPERRWLAVLLRFSLKEAVYKALFPYVNRYVSFVEASVDLSPNGDAKVTLSLEGREGPFDISARYHWIGDWVLTSARILPIRKQ